jgi:hypothetical protein
MDVEAMFADMGAFWEYRKLKHLIHGAELTIKSFPTPSTDG